MNPVDALPIESVLEATVACDDRARAREALDAALASARAPRRSPGGRAWSLSVRISGGPQESGARTAGAIIRDDESRVVAERSLAGKGACANLARAVGAWSTLVIDAELERARAAGDAPREAAGAGSVDTPSSSPPQGAVGWVALADPVTSSSSVGGEPEENPERPARLPARGGSKELSVALYFRGGSAAGGMVGLAPALSIEVSPGWLVRPSLAFGTVAAPSGRNTAHLGGRFDLCRRIHGHYIARRGLEADLCAGVDGGVVTTAPLMATSSAGPAMALRGDLSNGMQLELRGGLGASFLEPPTTQAARSYAVVDVQVGVVGRLP